MKFKIALLHLNIFFQTLFPTTFGLLLRVRISFLVHGFVHLAGAVYLHQPEQKLHRRFRAKCCVETLRSRLRVFRQNGWIEVESSYIKAIESKDIKLKFKV